jgi:parallel beta-helix repeat protein
MAEPKTKIKIKRGIYRERLVIKSKYDLEIVSSDPLHPAIIMSDNSPCLTITGLSEDQNIKISQLRFVQRGMREEDELAESVTKENCFIYQNANMIESLEINYMMNMDIMEGILDENRGSLSAISILSGTVMISDCQVTLAFLTTETIKIIPAIYAENSVVFVESVLIKGNSESLTVGIVSHNSNLKVSSCKILNHRCAGILCDLNERNRVTINKCEVKENTGCGIFAIVKVKRKAIQEKKEGTKNICEIKLEDNLIEKNQGVGLKIINCFNLNIIGNKIFENLLNGCELTDCSGLIMLNSFYKNKGAGALFEAIEEIFDAKIFKNTVYENFLNGLEVKGYNNFANISQNDKIGNNYLSGIFIHDKASPKINGNTVHDNMHQGVLIVSGSYAHVEGNRIFKNYKADIAFGGHLAENTKIINNEIFSSRSEGIFIIEAKGGLVARNKIYKNNDGIIIIKCQDVEISENEVYDNIRCGILISDMSTPKLYSNKIFENNFLGVFIRDHSEGEYEGNELIKNISQLYLSANCKALLPILKKKNRIEGRTDTAASCNIF